MTPPWGVPLSVRCQPLLSSSTPAWWKLSTSASTRPSATRSLTSALSLSCGMVSPQHTSPLRDLPAEVRVIRPQHALTGKVLKVFGKLNRKGQLHLVLTLPDGTRSYIPAAWTDLKPPDHPRRDRDSSLVASLSDLLCTRQRVDALLRRMAASPADATTRSEEHT